MMGGDSKLRSDIEVSVNIPVDIRLVHQIEREVDDAVGKIGFVRCSTTHHGEGVVIGYRQFAKALEG